MKIATADSTPRWCDFDLPFPAFGLWYVLEPQVFFAMESYGLHLAVCGGRGLVLDRVVAVLRRCWHFC